MAAESGKVDPPFGPPDVEWIKTSSAVPVTENTVDCGKSGSHTIYTGRIYHNGELLIGTVVPNKGCSFAKDGKCFESSDFEIMTVPCGGPLVFREVKEGASFPKNLFKAGKLSTGVVLYVGRHTEGNNMYIGWIDPDRHCLHVAQDGEEKVYSEFDILIHQYLDRLAICPPCIRPCPRN